MVKGFHLFPATQWDQNQPPVTVVLPGDHEDALSVAAELVRDAAGRPGSGHGAGPANSKK